MRDQASDKQLHALARALADVLPEDSKSDPQYLSRAALDICVANNLQADQSFASAIDCAQRFWNGSASEEERVSARNAVVNSAESVRKSSGRSPEWCRYALVMSALDNGTPSTGYAADYLLEFALDAGATLPMIQRALEAHVPGLPAALRRLASSEH